MDLFKISEEQYPEYMRISPFFHKLNEWGVGVMEMGGVPIGFQKGCIAILNNSIDSVYIGCLATYEEQRRQGAATQLLKAICKTADDTNMILEIPIPAEDRWRWEDFLIHVGVSHPVFLAANQPKNRMPEAMVVSWLKRFGFAFTGIEKEGSRELLRKPKTH